MGLLDELKKQIAATDDIPKLKTADSLLNKRIREFEGPEETTAEEPSDESTDAEEVSVSEEVPEELMGEAVEEPVEQPKVKPKPAQKAPKPKFAVGMMVYGTPAAVKFPAGQYRKGDEVAFEAKIEKIEGDKAIINYTDKDRAKALGNPPKRVRVKLSALEPVDTEGQAAEVSDEDDIPEED